MMMRKKRTAICWWIWSESWHFWLRSTLFHSLTPFTMNDQTQICLLFGPCPNVSVCSCTQWIELEIYNSQRKNPLSQKLKQDKYVLGSLQMNMKRLSEQWFYVNACYSRELKIKTPFYNFTRDPNQLKVKPLNSLTISSSGAVSPYTEPASCLGTIKSSKVIFGHSLNSRQTPTCPCYKGCLGVICFRASLVGI